MLSITTANGWAYTALTLLFAALLFFAIYLYAPLSYKRMGFYTALVLCISGALTTYICLEKHYRDVNRPEAIVMVPNTYVKSAPNANASDAFILHEGTKMRILERYENWCKVKLPDGKIGWLPEEDMAEI